MLPANPPPSAVLEELGQAALAASNAYRAAFEKFAVGRPARGLSRASSERYAREDFERTEEGAALAEACLDAVRRHDNALRVSDRINLGGEFFHLRELSQSARDRVYQTAAEHGTAAEQWPAEVRDSVLALCRASRTIRYDEAAAKRRQLLTCAAQATAARIVEARGGDPTAWTEADLDEVSRAAGRLGAFEQLVSRACAVDIEWAKRRTRENGQ